MSETVTWGSFLKIDWGWRLTLLAIGSLAVFLAALVGWWLPFVPRIHDEFSNLLAADTLLHGRLANPAPELWQPFQSFHIILQPAYASKYPLAPGAFTALGWLGLGLPVAGSWLAAGLCCVSAMWMLAGATNRRWAVIGGLMVASHPVMQLTWSQSLFGGWISAAAACLVVGGILRLRRRVALGTSLLLGSGVALLALSRPFEGLVFTLLSAGTLWWLWSRWPLKVRIRNMGRVAIWGAPPVCLALLLTAFQNHAVSGSYSTMPYQVHERDYGVAPLFVFGSPKNPRIQEQGQVPAIVAEYHQGWSLDCYQERNGWKGWLVGWGQAWQTLFQFWGLGLALLPLSTSLFWGRTRVGRAAIVVIGLQLMASAAVCWVYPHYLSPIVAWLTLAAVLGLRHLPNGWNKAARTLAWGLIGMQVLLLWGTTMHARRNAENDDWAHRRLSIAQQLAALPGKHLVLVHYADQHNVHEEWVYNLADLEESRVLWARGERSAWREQLFQHYSDKRCIWELRVDEGLPPKLLSRPGESPSASELTVDSWAASAGLASHP